MAEVCKLKGQVYYGVHKKCANDKKLPKRFSFNYSVIHLKNLQIVKINFKLLNC